MRAWCPTPGEGLVRPRTIEIVATERPLPGRNNQKSWWSCGRTSGPGRDRRARGVIDRPGQAKHASSAESVGGKNARRHPSPRCFSGNPPPKEAVVCRSWNRGRESRPLWPWFATSPPAFTVASPSLYRGGVTVKAGEETLLSSLRRARSLVSHPQILRKTPKNKELSETERGPSSSGAAIPTTVCEGLLRIPDRQQVACFGPTLPKQFVRNTRRGLTWQFMYISTEHGNGGY